MTSPNKVASSSKQFSHARGQRTAVEEVLNQWGQLTQMGHCKKSWDFFTHPFLSHRNSRFYPGHHFLHCMYSSMVDSSCHHIWMYKLLICFVLLHLWTKSPLLDRSMWHLPSRILHFLKTHGRILIYFSVFAFIKILLTYYFLERKEVFHMILVILPCASP